MAVNDGDAVVDKLVNGSRLVMEAPGRRTSGGSVAVAVFVSAGSRDERPSEWGAAHFLEHLAFKGAGGMAAETLADRMDRLGGDVNAFTTRELTCYHAHCLASDWETAFDLVWTLATAPHLAEADVDRERGVVRAELRDALGDAEDRAEEAYLRALWGRHPVARDVLGSMGSLERLDAAAVAQFHRRRYVPAETMVVMAGGGEALAFARARAAMAARMAAWPTGPAAGPTVTAPQAVGGERLVRVPGDQAYVVLGWPTVPWHHPDAMTHRLLGMVIGGQNTSRLWQRIREQEGLAYQVGASYSGQTDHGDLSLSAAVAADQVARVVDEMAREWQGLLKRPPDRDELDRARTQLKVGIVFQEETPEGRLHRLARWAGADLAVPTAQDLLTAVDRVTQDDVVRVLTDLHRTQSSHLALGVAGPRRALTHGLRDRFLEGAAI